MNEWLWLFPVAGGLWYWWDALRTRELARLAGRRACERAGVQFLDDTVARTRLRLRRNARGRLLLSRRYAFEFTSDGERRYPGSVEVFGARAERVEMAAYRSEDAVPPPTDERPPLRSCTSCAPPTVQSLVPPASVSPGRRTALPGTASTDERDATSAKPSTEKKKDNVIPLR